MRSFSNLWFWIVLAVMWSSISHWVLGVPWDVVHRAHKGMDERDLSDLEAMVRINTRRISTMARESGLVLAGCGSFVMTMLALLGFVYDFEFAQALFLLGFPISVVGIASVVTARLILRDELTGEALFRQLHRHRMITQAVGMASIFVTAMWSMLRTMTDSALH